MIADGTAREMLTRLSAMLTREIMPSANNSADGESETTAMPIILTKD